MSRVPSVAVAAVFLVGCSSSDTLEGIGTAGSESADVSPPTTREAASDPPDPTQDLDPPEAPATPEREEDGASAGGDGAIGYATREEWLAGQARLYGQDDPPTVEVVREVRPEETAEVMKECMAEFGFEIHGDPSGSGFSAEYPSEQREAFDEASYTCTARFPLMPVFYQPYDEQSLDRLYDYFAEEASACLESLGFAASDPPTRARFVESYRASGRLWNPAEDLTGSGFEDCLEIPSDLIAPEGR